MTYALSDLNALNGEVAYLTRNISTDGSDCLESFVGIQDKDIQENETLKISQGI